LLFWMEMSIARYRPGLGSGRTRLSRVPLGVNEPIAVIWFEATGSTQLS
jgi:hypothetical protein